MYDISCDTKFRCHAPAWFYHGPWYNPLGKLLTTSLTYNTERFLCRGYVKCLTRCDEFCQQSRLWNNHPPWTPLYRLIYWRVTVPLKFFFNFGSAALLGVINLNGYFLTLSWFLSMLAYITFGNRLASWITISILVTSFSTAIAGHQKRLS